jgi:hypothetical protein
LLSGDDHIRLLVSTRRLSGIGNRYIEMVVLHKFDLSLRRRAISLSLNFGWKDSMCLFGTSFIARKLPRKMPLDVPIYFVSLVLYIRSPATYPFSNAYCIRARSCMSLARNSPPRRAQHRVACSGTTTLKNTNDRTHHRSTQAVLTTVILRRM